jgi:large subunit ribosomal protein L10
MSKQVKGYIEKEFKNRFEGLSECMVVSVRGIPGVESNQMRGELKGKEIRLTVVKNSLAARAFSDLGMGPLTELLNGPAAIVSGGDSIVDLAKEMVQWDKKLDQFAIRGAYLDGKVLDAKAATALSKMPNRIELQGSIVMLANSPGSRLSGAATAPGGAIAGCLKTLIENKEKEEAA